MKKSRRKFIRIGAGIAAATALNAGGAAMSQSPGVNEPQSGGGTPETLAPGGQDQAVQSETFDYVVVRGGMAGCAVAARMSEDPRIRVLLLEAGQDNLYEHSYYSTGTKAMWEGETNWHTSSTPQTQLKGRRIDHPRGRVIGGSAALNIGSWSRGIAPDYDAWEAAGATGWGWPTALKTFQSIERSKRPNDESRGRKGPVHLEDTPLASEMTNVFREACIAAGFGTTVDHNGAKFDGFDLWETIFVDGRRRNTAEAYLATARSRPNLKVIAGALTTRVAIKGGRAMGVDYEVAGQSRRASSREVLLCAGAFNSPQLLMLSGIGPADHLRAKGIEVVADVPGVGANLIDHLCVFMGGTTASDGIKPVYPDPKNPAQLEMWRRTGYGPLSDTEYTSIAFIRSRPKMAHPDIELIFNVNPPPDMREDKTVSGFSILVAHLQPKSRGEIRLASADPHALPLIDFRYLSHADDVRVMTDGFRRAMAMAATPPLAPYGERRNYDPKASDAEIVEFIRSNAATMYHPVGTARMGASNDRMAVLDPDLRVRGINGLRVIDASSMPGINRGHTMAPALYVAERGCELIKRQAL